MTAPDGAADMLRGRRVLVTGGGFIGSRLAEVLVEECGADVTVLVRRPESAARLAGAGCRVVVGDVTDRAVLAGTMTGCDTVFHTAYGTSGGRRRRRFVNREGTRRVLQASEWAGTRRIVHLSTFMVYGRVPDGDITEDAPRRDFGTGYADSKREAERIALDRARSGRCPVVVLQPTNVYGPRASVWGEEVLERMRTGRIPLVDDGVGVANVVYVDDVVQAALLAATADGVVGEAFLVSSGETVTWRDFFGHFEVMLGSRRTVSVTAQDALAQIRTRASAVPRLSTELTRAVRERRLRPHRILSTREASVARRWVTALLPEFALERVRMRLARHRDQPAEVPGQRALTEEEVAFFASRARVRIHKAETELGFRPRIPLAEGIRRSADWAATAGLLA